MVNDKQFPDSIEVLLRVWHEQQDFNQLIRPSPTSFTIQSEQTRDLALCLVEEISELLRTVEWKFHRKPEILQNPAATRGELADIFKYWVSLCIVHNITPQNAIDDFWRKSMVCRQRYSAEFMQNIAVPTVVVDIDGVLCDYQTGFRNWLYNWLQDASGIHTDLIETVSGITNRWIRRQDLDMTAHQWQEMKHAFRISGAKSRLPVFPEAADWLRSVRDHELQIVLLTSRPISEYPNMYLDTVDWLNRNHLVYDHIWWAREKVDRLCNSTAFDHIRLAVDDDPLYVKDFSKAGIQSYWICRDDAIPWPTGLRGTLVSRVRTLTDILLIGDV